MHVIYYLHCNQNGDGENTDILGRISVASLWTFTGTIAVKASGGPDIPFRFGRGDAKKVKLMTV